MPNRHQLQTEPSWFRKQNGEVDLGNRLLCSVSTIASSYASVAELHIAMLRRSDLEKRKDISQSENMGAVESAYG